MAKNGPPPRSIADIYRARGGDIAALWSVSHTQPAYWHKRDGCPRNLDRSFDLREVIKWREGRIETRLLEDTGESGGRSDNLERWRGHKADLAKIELDKAKGILLPSADVDAGRVQRVAAVKAALLALPGTVAGQAPGMDAGECEAFVRGLVEEICNRFAAEGED
jgi:hypothetical protein